MKVYLKITIIFIIIILLLLLIPGLDGSYIKTSKLYINEVVSSNKYTLLDEDKESSDYIELYNDNTFDIDLEGYYLSDSEYEPKKWTFPKVTIKSKSYLIIYASGKDKYNQDNNTIHTSFKLQSTGEVLTLSESNGNIISKITVPELSPDIAYGYSSGKYFQMQPTPGKKNYKNPYKKENNKLIKYLEINEYSNNNKNHHYNKDGAYYDWVEIYNPHTEDITTKNLYLTDTKNKLNKYKLPEVVIKSNNYLLIYLSGLNKVDEEIHSNFKLSASEVLILSDGETIIKEITTIKLPDNYSYGLKENEWVYFPNPTPGSINNTTSFTKLGSVYNGTT